MAKDEKYIIDLCDQLLSLKALRQYRFEFLLGDTGRKLPVDAYYKEINLVIEYHERQHSEAVPFWDNKPTVSGISRSKQRAVYDQRRREILPQHGIKILEFSFQDFEFNRQKHLVRTQNDIEVISLKLAINITNFY